MDMKMKGFAEQMLEKYPDLFPKNKEGETMYPMCGLYCPQGWEHIVESALFYIDSHVKNPGVQQTHVVLYKISTRLHRWIVRPIYNKLYRMTDPTEKLRWKDGKHKQFLTLTVEQRKLIEFQHPIKTKLHRALNQLYRKMSVRYRSKPLECPPVTIDQVKEKFGSLRLYISGGDRFVHEIVGFAESLTARICEETGAPGKPVTRGGWCKTLSASEATRQGYK